MAYTVGSLLMPSRRPSASIRLTIIIVKRSSKSDAMNYELDITDDKIFRLSVDKFASELTDCLSVDEFASELTNCLSVGQNRLVHFWREEIGNRNRLVTRRRSRRRSRRRQPSSTMAAAAAALRRPSEATTPKISPLKISLYKCY